MIRIASVALPRSPMNLAQGDEVPQIITRRTRQRPSEFLISPPKRLLQHGVIPGSSQTKARESALPESMRPASCGLATMESRNGILCRTGRVVETDIDLCGGPDGVGRARGVVDSNPEAISVYLRSKAPDAVRVGLETGPT